LEISFEEILLEKERTDLRCCRTGGGRAVGAGVRLAGIRDDRQGGGRFVGPDAEEVKRILARNPTLQA